MHFAISPRRRGQGEEFLPRYCAGELRKRSARIQQPRPVHRAGFSFYRAPLWCLRALTQLRAGFGNPLTGLRQQPIFYRVGNT